ncbi:hypothetical protein CHELA40_14915 [Chelatococcus asaccharovorans]|nr:hypothetical protein CHELA17_60707 [Chelatococcus asaccharovorans]CAH1680734.1 hypothetical protein CHELA40_14915 [Chelatococcus asaccharovorans]
MLPTFHHAVYRLLEGAPDNNSNAAKIIAMIAHKSYRLLTSNLLSLRHCL